jgi:hypothetical protein
MYFLCTIFDKWQDVQNEDDVMVGLTSGGSEGSASTTARGADWEGTV